MDVWSAARKFLQHGMDWSRAEVKVVERTDNKMYICLQLWRAGARGLEEVGVDAHITVALLKEELVQCQSVQEMLSRTTTRWQIIAGLPKDNTTAQLAADLSALSENRRVMIDILVRSPNALRPVPPCARDIEQYEPLGLQ